MPGRFLRVIAIEHGLSAPPAAVRRDASGYGLQYDEISVGAVKLEMPCQRLMSLQVSLHRRSQPN